MRTSAHRRNPNRGGRQPRDRHQLERGNARARLEWSSRAVAPANALRAERADVQLVDHRLVPGTASASCDPASRTAWVDHLAGAVHVIGITARCRIGNGQVAIDTKAIARTVSRVGALQLRHAVAHGLHHPRRSAVADQKLNRAPSAPIAGSAGRCATLQRRRVTRAGASFRRWSAAAPATCPAADSGCPA